MIDKIIFDMDGTLIDTEYAWHLAWLKCNEVYGLGLDEKLMLSFIGMPKQNFELISKDIFSEDIDLEELKKYRNNFFNKYKQTHGIYLKNGVIRLLEYLKKKGYKLAVCTSTYEDRAKELLIDLNIYHYFDTITYGNEVKIGKPDPTIYKVTMSKLQKENSECLVFEDSAFGILSATRAGIRTCFVKDINDIDEDIRKIIYKEYHVIDEAIVDL